jgi:mono/diheme cytochrome c family protein
MTRNAMRILIGLIAFSLASLSSSSALADDDLFAPVAGILEKRCVECHSADEKKGGLSLQTRAALLAGGDSGPAITPGKTSGHVLLEMITGEKPEMPKTGPKLTVAEVASIQKWIAAGAPWPDGKRLEDRSLADSNWWSLQPLVRPAVPTLSGEDKKWVRNPLDAFVLAKLREQGFVPSPAADRRTLIRRLSFDLLGLPPAPEAVDRFVNDPDPQAYEKLVNQMLASPQYGERWARHWLDVVHFGETHGYDKDQPRRNAWPYRDYAIRALNQDKTYGRFIEEQLAGDVLYPNTIDGIEALGFIAAGPWDFIGHAEVPESKIDGKVARHLDRDDMVANALGTFNSLTVGCAQCHNHKFDPIKQIDYYRLQAVFAAVDRADMKYHADPAVFTRYSELETAQRKLIAAKKELDDDVKKRGGAELVALDQAIAAARQTTPAGLRPEYGYHSQLSPKAETEKWVQVDLGAAHEIAGLTSVGCYDNFNQIGAGFGFPIRYRIELSDDPTFKNGVKTAIDHSKEDAANPGTTPQSAQFEPVLARYIRFTATKLALRQNDYTLALAELQVLDKDGVNLAMGAKVTALDSIEAPPRWRQSNLIDGIYPGVQAASAGVKKLERLTQQRNELLAKVMDGELKSKIEANERGLASVNSELSKISPPNVVYAGTVHYGSGNFIGTGTSGGQPRKIHVLHRGDVKTPKEEVAPGALHCIPGLPGEFNLSAGHNEGERRAALAKWLSDRRNPLTWRSIVNRVWQYHFGRGLVDTPNDFGRMGQLPSHPELLDWLAAEFRDGGQSLKALHRLIVTSSTYQQRSQPDEVILKNLKTDPRKVDAGNVYLWRMNRRKLEAEAIRDAVLLVSGKLDLKMGGPSFQDFVIDQPAHSPHYEYHLHDPADPKSHRRSIYRFIVRSQPQPFMTTLDCADPSMRVDKRNESLSALQALALLNNGFMVTMSDAFAKRIAAKVPEPEDQVHELFRLAVSRSPTAEERGLVADYIRKHGLANACRAVINLNEFTFVD